MRLHRLRTIGVNREETIEVSLHERTLALRENEAEEAEKEIDVILERRRSCKREQGRPTSVLVTPPTLPCLPVFDALLLTHRSREPDITAEFDILILVLNLEDKVWDKFGGVSGIVECGMNGFAHDRYNLFIIVMRISWVW
ncbi:hypothetical protein Sjap_011532 [Stephania japonica]|uniref:Uncharacterized protein n=1 Tax=Stephania japonica TaxID=461633 RepID=A0AAP0JCK1_9MAGN